MTDASKKPYRRIATEEGWGLPEMFDVYKKYLLKYPQDDPSFMSLMGYYALGSGERPESVRRRLVDTETRLADMDAAGVDVQILSLTSPGTNPLPPRDATYLAQVSNDRMAEVIAQHPDRFAGLAAVPFTATDAGAGELERAVKDLGMKGVILNSHVRDEYTDTPHYFDFYEAAEALDVPVYIHPNGPSKDLIKPFHDRGLDGSIYGFGVETGLHLLRLVISGVFERYPNLKMVVGHLGEALPFWQNRIDYMYGKQIATGRYDHVKPLPKKPSEYLTQNVWYTTSGMPWEEDIMYTRAKVGADRVMYAMDYPYQYEPAEVAIADNLAMSDAEKFEFFEGIATRVFKL